MDGPFVVAARSAVGEWLSLVEHLVRDQGVGGSNPLSPTNFPPAEIPFETPLKNTTKVAFPSERPWYTILSIVVIDIVR